MAEISWSQAREQMLLDGTVANLNTGSFGPLPQPVFERATALRQRLAEEPMDFLRSPPPLLWEARERLGQFLNAPPQRLVFTANVTTSINLLANALRLASPGEILLTDHEYGAMHWCWMRRPTAGPDHPHVSAAHSRQRAHGDRRRRRGRPDAAHPPAVLQPRVVADRSGVAGPGTVCRDPTAWRPQRGGRSPRAAMCRWT